MMRKVASDNNETLLYNLFYDKGMQGASIEF